MLRPGGNAFLASEDPGLLRRRGLGAFDAFGDVLLLEVLRSSPTSALCAFCCCSRGFRCVASFEDLWRERFLESTTTRLEYDGSWKASLLRRPQYDLRSAETALYSDVLYQPRRVLQARPLLAAEASVETVRRADFDDRYPFVFANLFEPPPSEKLLFGDDDMKRSRRCHVGGYDVRLDDFLAYARSNRDDRPLILFDKKFLDTQQDVLETVALLEECVSKLFGEDLFALLAPEWRPDHRWLIVGGPGSGSTWHVDPNGTSAWNACFAGRKRWFFSSTPPEGVHPSRDGLDVAAPVSVIDWYLGFYKQKRSILECVVGPGDVVFVPSGWWHMVANIDDGLTVAVTQNFCSAASLGKTLRLLRERPHLVSGLRRPCDTLTEKAALGRQFYDHLLVSLRRHRPALLADVLKAIDAPTSLWGRILRGEKDDDDDAKEEKKDDSDDLDAKAITTSSSISREAKKRPRLKKEESPPRVLTTAFRFGFT
mmetsp:Transcript_28271/g.91141  ORF Transcript_28271/g.91141 Transcript_28271/m.91141 type:complete len:483 (-) Transcript_28271:878-2326(-)